MGKKLDEAIEFAVNAHKGQVRKLGGQPYILHCLEAATIASTMTDDEDVLCGAVLHDTVEDTEVTFAQIKEKFGDRVLKLVIGETENKRDNLPKEQTWKIRKQEAIDDLKKCDYEQKIVWLSDKLSNTRSIYRSWVIHGDSIFDSFHQKDKAEQKWYYFSVLDNISELKDTFVYAEYKLLINEIFR